MARMCKIEGIEFNSVMYEANEWVLASEVAPYIKEAVKTSHNRQSTQCNHDDIDVNMGMVMCKQCNRVING